MILRHSFLPAQVDETYSLDLNIHFSVNSVLVKIKISKTMRQWFFLKL